MATNDTVCKLLDLFQYSRSKGEKATLFLETRNGEKTLTFKVHTSAGPLPTFGAPAADFPPLNGTRLRRKTPSQLRRDRRRLDKFQTSKSFVQEELEKQKKVEEEEQPAEAADCSNDQGGPLVLQLEAAEGAHHVKKAAEIPQLDGGAEQEEVIKLIYQFDHQKGRGDRKVLEKNMRETMSETYLSIKT